MTTDPYLDPSGRVLRNRLGISDPDTLRDVEAGLSLAALADLDVRTLPGGYDLAHLQSFHQEIRVVQALFRQLSREAGWPVDWSGLTPTANAEASMLSLRGDNGPLRQLLDSLTAQ